MQVDLEEAFLFCCVNEWEIVDLIGNLLTRYSVANAHAVQLIIWKLLDAVAWLDERYGKTSGRFSSSTAPIDNIFVGCYLLLYNDLLVLLELITEM